MSGRMGTKLSGIKKGGSAAVDKSIYFVADNDELIAAVSRYFKYVHQFPITTYKFPVNLESIKTNSILVIQNEIEIDNNICGIIPFWFNYGIRNNIIVYGFTYETTDWQNNLLDWQDFLGFQWLERFQDTIDPDGVPYFDSAKGVLYGILRPHGGDSLYDLAADFHMTFANAEQYIGRLKQSTDRTKSIHEFRKHVLERGIARFREFRQKEPRYRSFLSILPGADQLFAAVSELGKLTGEIEGVDIVDLDLQETLSINLPLIQVQTSFIHSFFLKLEPFIQGGSN